MISPNILSIGFLSMCCYGSSLLAAYHTTYESFKYHYAFLVRLGCI